MTGGIALDENSFTHFGNFSETTQPIFNRRHLAGKKNGCTVDKTAKQGPCNQQQ